MALVSASEPSRPRDSLGGALSASPSLRVSHLECDSSTNSTLKAYMNAFSPCRGAYACGGTCLGMHINQHSHNAIFRDPSVGAQPPSALLLGFRRALYARWWLAFVSFSSTARALFVALLRAAYFQTCRSSPARFSGDISGHYVPRARPVQGAQEEKEMGGKK